jgi:cytochrome c biogenesis protein CcmG, thiol:disulfide interchange protein DsbE
MRRALIKAFWPAVLAVGLTVGAGVSRADSLDLAPYRGKVVYLDFWASWCTPCRRSFPWLDNLVRQLSAQDLVVIGVNVDQSRNLAEQFLNETPAHFPIVYDPRGDLATAYKIVGMPSAVLIDRTGRVRFQHVGFSEKTKDEYEAHVHELLAETSH